MRESARKRMFKRSIPRTVCKGEPGERIHTQKNVREIIHYQELMQRRRTWCKNSTHKRMIVQEIHDQELALQSITNNAYIHRSPPSMGSFEEWGKEKKAYNNLCNHTRLSHGLEQEGKQACDDENQCNLQTE